MPTKLMSAKIKATEPTADGEAGQFEALVATYDPDSVGDRIVPGAFKNTLAEWTKRAESGERLPVIWSHDHNDPFSHIGEVIEASETDDGLEVKGQLDLDNPTALQVYRLIKGGRIRNWSFAYDPMNDPETDDAGLNLLKEIKVYEVGPTLIGANQATRTRAVKSAADEVSVKAGRVLSAKNETELKSAVDALTSAVDRIKSVLSQVAGSEPEAEGQEDQDGKSQPERPAKAEEPNVAKAEEPSVTGPDDELLAFRIQHALHEKGIVA